MNFSTTLARLLIAGMIVAVTGSAAAQQAYPSKPIRFITPYPPGGSTTILVRIIGQKLTESWGQQVIVDNRPGGNTVIGTEALAKSPPDGYTLLLTSNIHSLIPQLLPAPPYDPIKDFAAVATVASGEMVLVLNPSLPAKDLLEFMALAKSKPGQLNYATAGSGSVGHMAGELFNIMAGVKMQHIPYKGTAPAVIDLIAGQVQLSFQPAIVLIQHIKSGKLKAIAISGEARSPALPQVPTFTEAGLPGFNARFWQGIFAPAGTPIAIVDKLSTEITKILAMPDIKEKLADLGMDPYVSTPAQFAAQIKVDMAQFTKIIKTANIKLDD